MTPMIPPMTTAMERTCQESSDQGNNGATGTNLVTGVADSTSTDVGVTGVNWNVSILPVKAADTNGELSEDAIIAGLYYCVALEKCRREHCGDQRQLWRCIALF